MLFDLQKFVQELRENEEKKEMLEKYEKLFGTIEWQIEDQVWYKEYLTKFSPIEYVLPTESKDDFDWNILTQLVAGSFSSEVVLNYTEDKTELPEMIISVENDGKSIAKMVSELRGFQILRLYEIYVEEQMNFQIHFAEDEKEKEEIQSQRDYKFRKRWLILDNMGRQKAEIVDTKEKEEKLTNLYDQL